MLADGENDKVEKTKVVSITADVILAVYIGTLSNDNGDDNEKVRLAKQ